MPSRGKRALMQSVLEKFAELSKGELGKVDAYVDGLLANR
jgi:hypothetical protein